MKTSRTLYIAATLAVLMIGVWLANTLPAVSAPTGAAAPLSVSSAKEVGDSAADEPVKDAAAELELANDILSGLSARYTHLDDVAVVIGSTPKGEEAVAYYTADQIVIDRDHTVSVRKILAHEIWHVIDWRDNGRLDWGEDLPPANSADYLKR